MTPGRPHTTSGGRDTALPSTLDTGAPPAARVVGVLPDVPAIGRVLDYLVPEHWTVVDDGAPDAPPGEGGGEDSRPVIRRGSLVRAPLQGRRVRGWVVATHRVPEPGRQLRPLAAVVGCGPPAELVDLAEWAAWRWVGRPLPFLRAASPERVVRRLPQRHGATGGPTEEGPAPGGRGPGGGADPDRGRAAGAERVSAPAPPVAGPPATLPDGATIVRLPPAADPMPWLTAALDRGQALILTPGQDDAATLAGRLRRAGYPVARHPEGWAAAATGATVVASRAGAWMPAGELAAVVVLDEHDPRYRDERLPAWHARDVALERARRGGVPCLLVSPTPSLEALVAARLLVPSRAEERAGWPTVELVDRTREDDPFRHGLYGPALVRALRSGRRVGVVLNRTGRARLLACGACGRLATCERCGRALHSATAGRLTCPRCGDERPAVCAACGGGGLRLLRVGVTRVREELEALLREPVGEITAASAASGGADTRELRVVVGTEALLHRAVGLELVAFLDVDADLYAPRTRAGEQVLGQLARAARLVGGRGSGGRLLVQTRQPRHEVLQAVLHADPGRWARAEAARRRQLELPPFAGLAELSGPAAAEVAAAASRAGLAVLGPRDGRYLVRAPDPSGMATLLCRLLDELRPPAGALRVEVDPADA